MEQEFKIPKNRKERFLTFAFGYFVFFVGFLILGVFIWKDPTSSSFSKYVFIPWFTFTSLYNAISFVHKANFMKILITENQIRFESLGIIITSTWSRLMTIENCGTIFKNLDGISVIRSSVKRNIFGLFETRSNHIPIHNFGDNWCDSDLGQQIKQHAPHLFEKEKSAQSA